MNQDEVSASCLQLAFCGCSSGNSCDVSTANVPVFGCLLDASRIASVETRVETQGTFHWGVWKTQIANSE